MFGRILARGLLAFLATMFAGTAMAGNFTLPDLPAGSEYQILFTTAGGTTATSANIEVYDNFVTQQADANRALAALGATWTAVASTATSSGTQASNTTNIPIYDTRGDLLEPDFPALFTDSSFYGPLYDQNGSTIPTNNYYYVWTGMTYNAGVLPASPLGSEFPTLGVLGHFDWIGGAQGVETFSTQSLYAISSPITVTPEPSTLALLGSALLGIGVVYLKKRERTRRLQERR